MGCTSRTAETLLDVRVVYYNRFDSEPPVAVSEFDYGVTLGVGYNF